MQIVDLAEYRRQHAQTTIERESDPEFPNRNFWLIQSESRDAVQAAIAGLVAEVESFGNGYGSFIGPHRKDGIYFAIGETVIRSDVG
jgi:hypothetical protein